MNRSLLVKLFGFRATLIHHDTLVMDRWRWLRDRLPQTRNGEKLLDIGCGTGAFTIGASLRGYESLGLSWDQRNQRLATERAGICNAHSVKFDVLDVRDLDSRKDLQAKYDFIICCECIEHIKNDMKLMCSMADCLKSGGKLLLTTPYDLYVPISKGGGEEGPFSLEEDGGHVRRGYSRVMLEELCEEAGLKLGRISYCSGFVSQKITKMMRAVSRIHPMLSWVTVLPLRFLPLIFDRWLTPIIGWPQYCICLEAHKARF